MSSVQGLSLKVPYTQKILPVILSFARDASAYYGADEQEAQSFELSVEEAAVTIIDGLPSNYAGDDYFLIKCSTNDTGIIFTLQNMGLPVDAQRLPKYSTDNPEESTEGLSLHLMTSLMDQVKFENKGHDGWQTYLFKEVKNVKKDDVDNGADSTSRDMKRHLAYDVKIAPPELAYEVSKLTYFNYGYSYSKDNFYYPEQVASMIEQKKVVSIVAIDEQKRIIGHLGLRIEEEQDQIAEVMLAMVHPDYRGSKCFYKMSKTMFEYCIKSHLKCLYSGLVTKHVYSQKSAIMFGMKPTAFRLSLHQRAKYKSMESSDNQRESLLDAFAFVNHKQEPIKVCFPEQHRQIMEKTLANLSLSWEEQTRCELLDTSTQLSYLEQTSIGLANIQAKTIGLDFIKEVAILTKSLSMKRLDTIYLWIDLDTPSLEFINKKLETLGYFYCGIRPKDLEKWQILYTFFNNQRFDYSGVKVADPFAQELLNHIECCDKKVQIKQIELLS